MFRTLLRTMIVVVVVVAAIAFVAGYRAAVPPESQPDDRPIVGMTGRMNERPGAERATGRLDEAAEASRKTVERAGETLSNAALVAKISSKMALDDLVQARAIRVRADDRVITLEGHVRSEEERRRAVRLARETDGVQAVNDRLELLDDGEP